MPVTLRFQSTGAVPGNARPISMLGRSLTIGRADENDLVLPDPERQISKRHCAIEDHGGSIVVIDLSSNGTFLNYGKIPIGRVPTPLNDGDILTMGPYELIVQIAPGAAPARPPTIPDDPALLPEPYPDPVRPVAPILPPVDSPIRPARAGLPALGTDDGMDFLDELLGPGAPKGPPEVRRAELGEDGQLPPLGVDDLGPIAPPPEEPAGRAASLFDHGPAIADSFAIGERRDRIPDDWDDLLDGIRPAETPIPSPQVPAPSAAIARSAAPIPDPVQAAPVGPDTIPRLDDLAFRPIAPAQDAHGRPGAETLSPAPPPPPFAPGSPPPATQFSADSGPSQTGEAAARAFLAALGAGRLDLTDEELPGSMARLGRAMRAMIEGLREVLMTRSFIKQEFRIGMTMISSGGNNPLKFSVSPDQAVEAMVRPTTPGWLEADAAAEQALKDIKAHEVAMMTGMEAALKGVLKRLDPAELEKTIETTGGLSSLLKGQKARYWEAYEKMYAEVSDQAENDFHELFAREFARAYREQMDRLK